MRVSNFLVLIPQGRERCSGYVEVAHGQVYTIKITNCGHSHCDALVRVDGKDVGGFRVLAHDSLILERPADDTGCFTFFRSDSAEAQEANVAGVAHDDRGLVQVTFRPERRRQPVPTSRAVKMSGSPELRASGGMMPESCSFAGEEKTSGGITGLTGQSDQRFRDVAPLDYDPQQEVVITLRLVAGAAVRELRPVARGNPVPAPVE